MLKADLFPHMAHKTLATIPLPSERTEVYFFSNLTNKKYLNILSGVPPPQKNPPKYPYSHQVTSQ